MWWANASGGPHRSSVHARPITLPTCRDSPDCGCPGLREVRYFQKMCMLTVIWGEPTLLEQRAFDLAWCSGGALAA